jgi:hypothetical protein
LDFWLYMIYPQFCSNTNNMITTPSSTTNPSKLHVQLRVHLRCRSLKHPSKSERNYPRHYNSPIPALNFQASTGPSPKPRTQAQAHKLQNSSLVTLPPSAEPRQAVLSATRLADAPSPPQPLRIRRGICTAGSFLPGDTGEY